MGKLIKISLMLLTALGLLAALPWLNDASQESGQDLIVRVYIHETDKVQYLSLENYVTGVTAAEMPAVFPQEALRAQSVAARTYIVRRILAGGVFNNDHEGADTCNDPAHAQGYINKEQMRERWGKIKYYQYYNKIRSSVDDTAGKIITYQGQLIDPVYHSACGGCTENAEDVWAFAVPYLRSVDCPYEEVPELNRQVTILKEQLANALNVDLNAVAVSSGNQLIQVVENTSTGRPKTLQIGDRQVSSSELRQKLALRSTNFTWAVEGEQIIINTTGNGHGVGMCQYGAGGLAKHGYDYQGILNYYYTDVQINDLKDFI